MKNLLFISVLTCLVLVFFGSCEKELATKNDVEIDFRKRGGNGGGPNADREPKDLYSVIFNGTVFQNDTANYRQTTNNSKYSIMGPDCGDMIMTGLNEVFDSLGTLGCYSGPIWGDWREIRQFDKKKNPEKVAAHFAFPDPVNSNYVRLSIFGVIDNQETSIFPTSTDDDVKITLDRWKVTGMNPSCEQEETVTFESIGLPDQKITIKLLADKDCP